MGGGGSKSTSKPVYTPQQKEVFKWMQANIQPLAEGKETYISQLMAQRARDEGARLQSQQEQGILQAGGVTGMSAGQISNAMQQSQSEVIKATLANILANRQAMQQQALQMIAGIPLAPGEEKVTKGPDPFKAAFGEAAGKGLGELATSVVGGGMTALKVPGAGGA